MAETLSLRKTQKYVGTHAYMDTWEDIGMFDQVSSTLLDVEPADEEDPCEYRVVEHTLLVRTHAPCGKAIIEQALRDVFTKVGCAHEYDCCGCRSHYVLEVTNTHEDTWVVKVGSSRNY